MGTIQAILFDMDGVLVNTEPTMRKSAKLALNEWNIFPIDEDFTEFIGRGEDLFVGGVAEKHGVPYDKAMKHRAYAIFGELIGKEIYVYDGIRELIQKLRADGFKIAVCTSADKVKVGVNFKAADIQEEWFDAIVSAQDVERTKPYPDLFLKGSELVGIPPDQCVVIEDAVSGIKAAKTAGMRNIAVASTHTAENLQAQAAPDTIVRKVTDITYVLTDWNQTYSQEDSGR